MYDGNADPGNTFDFSFTPHLHGEHNEMVRVKERRVHQATFKPMSLFSSLRF